MHILFTNLCQLRHFKFDKPFLNLNRLNLQNVQLSNFWRHLVFKFFIISYKVYKFIIEEIIFWPWSLATCHYNGSVVQIYIYIKTDKIIMETRNHYDWLSKEINLLTATAPLTRLNIITIIN